MGAKPIPRSTFEKFLQKEGLIRVRTKGSHDIYEYADPGKKLSRPITVKNNLKDVPMLHIHTNLGTLGISKKDFTKKIKDM
jgi:predicted RNA binding protein YcfA (HicA-like mRNA interferase family)